nr:MAG TPA: hypothetical protein [Caudoviricetes sp.]
MCNWFHSIKALNHHSLLKTFTISNPVRIKYNTTISFSEPPTTKVAGFSVTVVY